MLASSGAASFSPTVSTKPPLPAASRQPRWRVPAGDTRTLRLAGGLRVNLLQELGRLKEARRVGEELLLLLEEAHHIDTSIVLRDLAYVHALQGDFATSGRLFDRSFDLVVPSRNPFELALILALRGWLAALTGDRQQAHAKLDQALTSSHQTDRTWYLPYASVFLARIAQAEGDWATAMAAAQEALNLLGGDLDMQALRMASGVMAEVDVLEGRAEAAKARLVPLLDQPGLQECEVTIFLPVLAWAQLELGEVDLAANTVEQALARARPEEMRLVLVEALRVQALVALHRGQWDDAARSLEEGLALARAMPYPYAEARLLHLDGMLHAQRGEHASARERLEAARSTFARIGARMDVERVEQALDSPSQNDGQGRFEMVVSDAQWAQVQAVLPPPARTGRHRADDRRILEAILYQQRTGCAWARPAGSIRGEATAHRRLRQWQGAGLWERIEALVQPPPTSHHELDDGSDAPNVSCERRAPHPHPPWSGF